MSDLLVVTAQAALRPCELYVYHAPVPVVTEGHHPRPIYLQNRLYGRTIYGDLKYFCSNCHDAVHAWLYWLLGERQKPNPEPGRNAKAEALATYRWYLAEKERLGK